MIEKEKIKFNKCREFLNDDVHKRDEYYECICGNIIKIIPHLPTNMSSNNNKKENVGYDKVKTFRDKINDFEGKCVKNIPPKTLIDEIFRYYRHRQNIGVHDIHTYLKTHSKSVYYEAKYYILYEVIGIEPYDLSDVKDEIFMWYKKIQNWHRDKYNKYMIDKAILYFLVRRFKPKVNKKHIFFLKTPDKQMEYRCKWDDITEKFSYLKIRKHKKRC